MPKRNTTGSGSGGRKRPAGRSGARSSSRDNQGSSSRRDKPFGRSRGDRDDSKPSRPSRFSSDKGESKGGFSKSPRPRSEKPFGRSKDDSSSSSRGEGSFSRPRRDDDSKPKSSRFSDKRDDSKGGFSSRGEKPFGRSRRDEGGESKPRTSRFSGDRDDRKGGFSKSPRGGKSFGRSKDDSSATSRGERPYSRPRRDDDESKPRSSRFSGDRDESKRDYSKPPRESKSFSRSRDERDERPKRRDDESSEFRPKGKSGFFSKLSRGGKSFEKRSHDKDFGKSVKDFSSGKEEAKDNLSDKIRLNKYISNSGVCSRREADELIKMGLVAVNGVVITELGYKVNRNDVIKYDGKTLRSEKPVYILMNKPKGFLTTTKDPLDRNTVMAIIAGAVKERVYPVGRLDRNTTGLLLLTNDGDLTEKLSHPSYNVKKIYKVELDKPLTKEDFKKIMDGIVLEEGRAVVDDLAIVSDDNKTVGIELHIGWNRVVRRIFERLGYTVVKLDRSIYAGLDKKDLARGHWRFLTNEEVVRLKHYNN
jgi:23S rRNA pseudouridine2605 synthase